MAAYVERDWTSRFAPGGASRIDRASGRFGAYVPDDLADRAFRLDSRVAADVADAERNVARLDSEARSLASTEALARILLRAEAVASSRIEGLTIGAKRLLRAAAAHAAGEARTTDATAEEVLANVDAMVYALSAPEARITVSRLLEVHRRLLEPTTMRGYGGVLRDVQNWIGGTRFNPFAAAFVPPPPELVSPLLEDLCAFCDCDDLPAIAQAAIAHAQFETIHPFVDGNGRTGRALIHMVLARRGLATRTVVPMSLVLATHADDYVASLTATRYVGAPDFEAALDGIDRWVGTFAASCSHAVANAEAFERRMSDVRLAWRARLGKRRADSTAQRLVDRLPATPIVTARSVESDLRVSFEAANNAVAELEAAGVISKIRVGRRNRAYEAADVLDAFADLERQLASPENDTLTAPPSRSVPARRERRDR